jgi:hypothetical protein
MRSVFFWYACMCMHVQHVQHKQHEEHDPGSLTLPSIQAEAWHDEHQVRRTVARGLSSFIAVGDDMPSFDDLLYHCPILGLHDLSGVCDDDPSRRTFASGSQLAFVNLDGAVVKGWLPLSDTKTLQALVPAGTNLVGVVLVPESVVRLCCGFGHGARDGS